MRENRAFNKAERDWMAQQLGGLGLDYAPSFGNFILVKFPDAPDRNADAMLDYLKSNGVIVREMGAYRLGEWLRVSIGTAEANRRFIDLLSERFGDGG